MNDEAYVRECHSRLATNALVFVQEQEFSIDVFVIPNAFRVSLKLKVYQYFISIVGWIVSVLYGNFNWMMIR